MNKFIQVFNIKDKEYLLNQGYSLINEEKFGESEIYTFLNENGDMTFTDKVKDFIFSDTITL